MSVSLTVVAEESPVTLDECLQNILNSRLLSSIRESCTNPEQRPDNREPTTLSSNVSYDVCPTVKSVIYGRLSRGLKVSQAIVTQTVRATLAITVSLVTESNYVFSQDSGMAGTPAPQA